MRVQLVTEGTYPLTKGGVSTWCDHLIRSLPDLTFDVLALGPTGTEPLVWQMPANVESTLLHGVWGKGPSARAVRRSRRNVRLLDRYLLRLWRGILGPDTEDSVQLARTALRRMVELDDQIDLAATLRAQGSSRALATAWKERSFAEEWPELTVSQAIAISTITDRTLELLSLRPPEAEIIHATANGPCGLVALAGSWRTGARIVLTEHGVYLREQYIAMRKTDLDWSTRRGLTAFTRRICEVVLREATSILPVSDFNQNWEARLGADPRRVHTILNGVSTDAYGVVETEPEEPTISFVGRIDPLKDLETLIRAHAEVISEVPGTRLRIFGPTPEGNENYRQTLEAVIDEVGTRQYVSFEGPVNGSRPAIIAGHVVALSSISEGMPYTLIESMMCGRATVSTDVGGVSECAGVDGSHGFVVPPRQPEVFAQACVALLKHPDRRQKMGEAAARAARERFSLEGFAMAYHEAYEDALLDAPTRERILPVISASAWYAVPSGTTESKSPPQRVSVLPVERATGSAIRPRRPGSPSLDDENWLDGFEPVAAQDGRPLSEAALQL